MREVMKSYHSFSLTREKHLDHMVRVVPFIVFCYAIQCFVIMKMDPGEFSSWCLSFLGGFLALMVAGFITYDLKHQVLFNDTSLTAHFLWSHKTIHYSEILAIVVEDPSETFSTLVLLTRKGKQTFYFVDDAPKIKEWLESKKNPEEKLAA